MFTIVYTQVYVYIAKWTSAMWSETNLLKDSNPSSLSWQSSALATAFQRPPI